MGGSPEQRTHRRLRHSLEHEFPHWEPTVLVALPSSVESEVARDHLMKLRRLVRDIDDSATTGWDASAPAVWLIARGTTLILIVNGSWRPATWSRGLAHRDYPTNDQDGSVRLGDWLNEVWPRISNISVPCLIQKSRSNATNENLLTRLKDTPLLKDSPRTPCWGRYNQELAKEMRSEEENWESTVTDRDHSTTSASEAGPDTSEASELAIDRLLRESLFE